MTDMGLLFLFFAWFGYLGTAALKKGLGRTAAQPLYPEVTAGN